MTKARRLYGSHKPRRWMGPAALSLVLAAGAPPVLAAPQTRIGTFRIKATIALSANVPTSATLSGSAMVSAQGTLTSAAMASQRFSGTAEMQRSGNNANVTISVPYSFTFDSSQFAGAKIWVLFFASTSNGGDVYQSRAVAFPASGVTTTELFDLVY